ncbi:hypothetical protein L1049_002978 [Liquidambar formosana]|uniref:Uncharacterized protein n=1 Tax=Liquidambar formosana TaxID=63359 RepID=A0AAP0NLC0_LIQFO
MTPTNTSSTTGVRLWNSPIPYLFGGLALMLGLIAVALVVLVCTHRKHSSNSSSNDAEEKPVKPTINTLADAEPKIVVIMAGENNPTYIATPAVTFLPSHTEQV